jgi:hypothetical protein
MGLRNGISEKLRGLVRDDDAPPPARREEGVVGLADPDHHKIRRARHEPKLKCVDARSA